MDQTKAKCMRCVLICSGSTSTYHQYFLRMRRVEHVWTSSTKHKTLTPWFLVDFPLVCSFVGWVVRLSPLSPFSPAAQGWEPEISHECHLSPATGGGGGGWPNDWLWWWIFRDSFQTFQKPLCSDCHSYGDSLEHPGSSLLQGSLVT